MESDGGFDFRSEPPAGARQISTAVGGNAIGIPGTRGQVPRRPKSAGFLLQGGTRFGLDGKMPAAQTRKPSGVKWAVKPPQRPRPAREFDNGPTPLAQALNENGLGHFARKLCDE